MNRSQRALTRASRARTHDGLQKYMPKSIRWMLWVPTAAVMCLVVGPCIYLLVWSWWGTSTRGVFRPIDDPTTQWFSAVLADRQWRQSLWYSISLSCAASIAASIVALVYSYAVRLGGRRIDSITFIASLSVLLLPAMPYGFALRFAGSRLGFAEWALLWAGNVALTLPLQLMVFEAAREQVAASTIQCARTLGAGHLNALLHVFLPQSLSPLFFAAVLGFFVSFDEIVLAAAVLERSSVTVPRRLWDDMSQVSTPDSAVISTLVVTLFLMLLFGHRLVSSFRRSER